MRCPVLLFALMYFSFAVGASQTPQEAPQATIEMSGSTNTAPVKLSVSSAGAALVHVRQSGAVHNNVEAQVSSKLFEDLQSIGSLNALPRVHCIKSASFGTSLYVEFHGEQSPDLNCPASPGSKTATLKKDVEDIMQATHTTPRIGPRPLVPQVQK